METPRYITGNFWGVIFSWISWFEAIAWNFTHKYLRHACPFMKQHADSYHKSITTKSLVHFAKKNTNIILPLETTCYSRLYHRVTYTWVMMWLRWSVICNHAINAVGSSWDTNNSFFLRWLSSDYVEFTHTLEQKPLCLYHNNPIWSLNRYNIICLVTWILSRV